MSSFNYFLVEFPIFFESGEGRWKRGTEHQWEREGSVGCLSDLSQTGTEPTTQAGCPDWDLNQRPLPLWVDAQSTETHQSGWNPLFQRSPTFFGTRDWFCGRQFFHGWVRGMAGEGRGGEKGDRRQSSGGNATQDLLPSCSPPAGLPGS